MKLSLHEELEVSDALAVWLVAFRNSSYLSPKEIPQEALEEGLVEGSFPDFMLTPKGRLAAKELFERSYAVTKKLCANEIPATEHALGVLIPFSSIPQLLAALGLPHD
jgi:hypothetical protein